jgi:hypothetical protein
MAKAETVNQTLSLEADVPADRFWVSDRNGDDAQVRLDNDGKVYVGYTRDGRRTIEGRTLLWSEFLVRFRQFIDSIPRK